MIPDMHTKANRLFWTYITDVEAYITGDLFSILTRQSVRPTPLLSAAGEFMRRIEEQMDITEAEADTWRRDIMFWMKESIHTLPRSDWPVALKKLTWESHPKLKIAIMRFMCLNPDWITLPPSKYRRIDDPWEPSDQLT